LLQGKVVAKSKAAGSAPQSEVADITWYQQKRDDDGDDIERDR